MSNFRTKTKILMIGLAISCFPLNKSLCIQNLQFATAPWSNIPRKQLTNVSSPFYEASKAHKVSIPNKNANFAST